MRPVFGSENTPEALQGGSSGNKSRKKSSLDLNWFTDLFEMEEIQGGRQFHKLDAVNAKDEFLGICAGLWCITWSGREHLIPLR